MKSIFTTLFFSFFFIATLLPQSQSPSALNEIIVWLEPGQNIEQLIRKVEATSSQPFGLAVKEALVPEMNVYLLSFEKSFDVNLTGEMDDFPEVKSATLNTPVQFRDSIPNDTLFPFQWDMQRIGLPEVWDVSTGGQMANGREIVVAVLDKGFDTNHIEFQNNIWTNPGEIPGDNMDNDGNALTDDIHGWNFIGAGSPNFNIENHGTWVAGIIGAEGNNVTGLAGVNWHVKLMFIGVTLTSDVIKAFNYVSDMRQLYHDSNGERGAFIVVTNGSFGQDKTDCSAQPVWAALYDTMGVRGVLSVAATANDNWDVDEVGDLPTGCPSEYLITVTNTDSTDNRNSGAAYGKTTIDLGAPGTTTTTTNTLNRFKKDFGGTSSACPHVAGTVALLYSLPCTDLSDMALAQPAETARLIRDAIFDGVDPIPSLKDETVTGGRLNVANAMKYLHSYCIARPEERSAGNFKEIYFIEKNFVRIFPNPTADLLTVEYSNEGFTDISVRIFNAIGQEMISPQTTHNVPFEKQQLEIDVSQWASGTYIVTIAGQEKNTGLKFIKI